MSVTNPELPIEIVLGNMATLSTTVKIDGVLTDDPGIQLAVRDPDGIETVYTSVSVPAIQHTGTGAYALTFFPPKVGQWYWRWLGDASAQGASEGTFEVVSEYVIPTGAPDLTDLLVLVPKARRYVEGPYGPPTNRPPLEDDQIYAMVADACADIILLTGSLFNHQLLVKSRDARVGFPTAWKTDAMLTEWESSVVTIQTALNFFFCLFRDLKSSETIKNEGTEWQYTISVNVIRDYLATLQNQRDLAIKGLRYHNPVIDRFASNIRVRDRQTVSLLEWWATNIPDNAPGLPGGQEAAVVPWVGGVSPI